MFELPVGAAQASLKTFDWGRIHVGELYRRERCMAVRGGVGEGVCVGSAVTVLAVFGQCMSVIPSKHTHLCSLEKEPLEGLWAQWSPQPCRSHRLPGFGNKTHAPGSVAGRHR